MPFLIFLTTLCHMMNSTLCSKLQQARLKATSLFVELVSRGEQVDAETLNRLQASTANQRLQALRQRLQGLLQAR
jgi:hypothetical protein